ncbi:pyridoxal-dependent decarboxylase [Candidatus Poriferisocius sp.]|uniref:pyridoxal-dependent decarboxylase n=1 Tax=Candidatus Poriferisocius sp. TaxID=3101276 RepID=UPI003B5C63E0
MAERPDHMDPEEFRRRGHQAVDWVADYLARLDDFPVMAGVGPGDVRDRLPDAAPEYGEDFTDVLADLDRVILPGLTHWQAPGMYGYFPANSSGPSVLGELISAGLGAHGAMWTTGPAVTELEQLVLDWLVAALGLPPAFRGNGVITDGASSGTLCAILAARDRAGGADDLGRMTAYVSEQAHYSMAKGLRVAGLPDSRVRRIATTPDYAMRADHLAYEIVKDRNDGLLPFFVGATIGTTSTTAVDPVPELAWVASNFDAWIHVDAAFAGTASVCPELRHLNAGLDEVDSYLFNPHKWMLTNLDCSVFYVADRRHLLNALATEAEYLSDGTAAALAEGDHETVDYRDWSVALGRRFRALKLWFVIRHYGLEGLRAHVRRHVAWAKELAEWVAADHRFELAVTPVLSLVCFRHVDGDEASRRVMDHVNNSGRAFISHTTLEDRLTLRVAIGSPHTEHHHLQELWTLLRAAA